MIKVLFICHGNICRSPMAEFVFKDMVSRRGLPSRFFIASAATSTEEIWNGIGNPVYPPARQELAKHGISCGDKRAVQLKASDYEDYDYLIGMDAMNIRNIERMTGHRAGRRSGCCYPLPVRRMASGIRGIRVILRRRTGTWSEGVRHY